MRIHTSAVILAVLFVTGCNELATGYPAGAEIRSDPSILIMGNGDSRTVVVSAFVGNEAESVRWNIGNTGNGVQVVEDTTFGRTYIGNRLVLPDQSHERRYVVTMTDTLTTSFVISGGTGIVTIQVLPPTP